MKSIYFIPIAILFFTGCSTTYRVTDFKSRKEFYNNFNDFMNDKDGEVTLRNDSALSFENGVKIKNDSLIIFNTVTEPKIKILPLNEIEKIDYYGSDFKNPSANLLLKNGKKIDAKNITMLEDSMKFISAFAEFNKNIIVPLNKIKETTFKRNWGGIIRGFLGGALVGGLFGAEGVIFNSKNGGNPPLELYTFGNMVGGAMVGALIGSVVGYIIGWNYHYEFNP